ncbi:hypothetical protein GCM10017559_45900 [Streptosporangium longisporum]|uniref:Uncharacterized protein n=1 Tax=Streptosporangium longisporum TaxID=46187 RepID=A0ABP6KSD8_9ACTN
MPDPLTPALPDLDTLTGELVRGAGWDTLRLPALRPGAGWDLLPAAPDDGVRDAPRPPARGKAGGAHPPAFPHSPGHFLRTRQAKHLYACCPERLS